MYIPRVKICGITDTEDALCAVACGASAIGFVFYGKSPRAVSVEAASKIASQLPPFVTRVGLFVDELPERIRKTYQQVGLDLIQFHGNETPDECAVVGLPYIKAIRVQTADDIVDAMDNYPGASAILADAYKPGVPGGTGEKFDWNLIPQNLTRPLILAGGLNADNVSPAIAKVKPFAVDVSGGVESARGIKDQNKIAQFMREVMNGYQVN